VEAGKTDQGLESCRTGRNIT